MANKPGSEVVEAREFDITQYGKWMAALIGVITPAIFAALKLADVKEVTTSMVIASLAVTGVAILGASLVISVDMLARAIVTRNTKTDAAPSGNPGDAELEPGETQVTTIERTVSRG
jgi:hypothetical protein